MEEEISNLEYTILKYNEFIDDAYLKLSNLKSLYANDYDAMIEEKFRLEKEISSTKRTISSPYFARIDFKGIKSLDKCYIGKKGVSDFDNNIITVDWRAPIASVYYDSNIGKCEYKAPDGIIKGELLLKRQYEIESGKLISYNDVDLVSNDELLKPYLSVNADNRLKNIVSTIQTEQNRIIREEINKNLVVQGVAGSGKTTVALHRVAYLVYNYKDVIKPNDYMVIGPNKFFVNYISGVLPDLDVNGVSQNTLDEFLLSYVNENYKINNQLDIIKADDNEASFKVSMKMKEEIDKYYNSLTVIPDCDFMFSNNIILSRNLIKKKYDEIDKNTFKSIKSRIDRLIILLDKYIKNNSDMIVRNLIQNNVSQKDIDVLKNNTVNYLKKYFVIVNRSIKDRYIDILKVLNYETKNINKGIIGVEDIPSLIYIKYKFSGSRNLDNYKHIVIDEAQDYGVFTFYVLNKVFKNSTFSIYGDLAQSLYSYRSIKKWETLKSIFKNFNILKLNKSYRTTIEIMDEANKINELLGLDKAIPVIRHGEPVEYFNSSLADLISIIRNKYKTIAIITKDIDDSKNIYNELYNKIDIDLITKNNIAYNSNITVLPSYLSKGLEFDCVILINEKEYSKTNILDMRLLYVAKTRALHKLYISNEI